MSTPHHSRALIWITLFAILAGLLGDAGAVRAEPSAPAEPLALAAEHRVYLPLVLGAGALPKVGQKDSIVLIADALAAGEIDAEAALTYQVFASFGDARLPERFRSSGELTGAEDVFEELGQRFGQLSPATQATLRPFTIPPFHSGSWWDVARQPAAQGSPTLADLRLCDDIGEADVPMYKNWKYVDSAGGNVRVWWQHEKPEDEATARAYAVNADGIWATLLGLMQREPPSDGGDLLPCRGRDDRLDISLVDLPKGVDGQVYRYEGASAVPSPSFMLMDRDFLGAGIERALLIHELMHVFQNAFAIVNYKDYRWWKEATANWAIHYVENLDSAQNTNYEHEYAFLLLDTPELPLLSQAADSLRPYGAYLFPFFIQVKTGKVDFVRQSFERSESMPNSLDNLDGLIFGGFKEQWPLFSLTNLNRKPVDDYLKVDVLGRKAKLKADRTAQLEGAPFRSYPLEGNVAHLASHAYRYTFNEAETRSVIFRNPFYDGAWPTADVRALVKIGGKWREEDWTTRQTRTFCRELVDERIEELMVVISNSEWKDRSHILKPAIAPSLDVSNIACCGWQGVVRYHEWSRDEIAPGVYLSEWNVDMETRVTLKLANTPEWITIRDGLFFAPFPDTTITVRLHGWNLDDSAPPQVCSYDSTVTAPFAAERSRLLILRGERGAYGVEGDMPSITIPSTDSCGRNNDIVDFSRDWWKMSQSQGSQPFVSANGTRISGRYDLTSRNADPNNESYYTWELTALPPE